jgi:hypothetical protein
MEEIDLLGAVLTKTGNVVEGVQSSQWGLATPRPRLGRLGVKHVWSSIGSEMALRRPLHPLDDHVIGQGDLGASRSTPICAATARAWRSVRTSDPSPHDHGSSPMPVMASSS